MGVRARRREKLNRVTRSAPNQVDQLVAFGYEPQWAEIFTQQTIGWRSMHSQGRGLFSVLVKNLPDIDTRTVREAELVCNSLIGFNFGDGHLHNEDLIAAVQDEAAILAGRTRRGVGGVGGHRKQDPALQGHRRCARCDRARYLEGGRRGGRTAVAAQRTHPAAGDVVPRRVPPSTSTARFGARGVSTALVVGGGPNGLAAAVALAKDGVQVTVLEAADEVGGGARSSEAIVPGLLHDHCSAFHPMAVGSTFLNGLGLDRYGLQWRWPEIDCAHPLDGGDAGVLRRSLDDTVAGLGGDGPRWRRPSARRRRSSTRSPRTSWGRCCGCRSIR